MVSPYRMANNNGSVPSNSPRRLIFSYIYSEQLNITADDQGFNYCYTIKERNNILNTDVDNDFKASIDQKKSHCRLQKVTFTFVPSRNRNDNYRTVIYNGSVNEVPTEKAKLNALNYCYETRNGGISQRTANVERDFRRSNTLCNQERTYVLYSSSDTAVEGLVGILKIDYFFEYFNRNAVS
ncbi:3178_t:CDS:1 [Racocetra persica]|uniref:3178_t:CDS:1 n=1 Tax=Racocetra persica TaxID=160502 RepID=A0ACA9M6D5_9GLOM|nr:3178_t:CDS:1 [Racocetra persica]